MHNVSKASDEIKTALEFVLKACRDAGQSDGVSLFVNPATGYMIAFAINDKGDTYQLDSVDGASWYETERKAV